MILFLHMHEQTQRRLGRALLSDQNICSVCTSQVAFLCNIYIYIYIFIFEYDASKAGVCMLLWKFVAFKNTSNWLCKIWDYILNFFCNNSGQKEKFMDYSDPIPQKERKQNIKQAEYG